MRESGGRRVCLCALGVGVDCPGDDGGDDLQHDDRCHHGRDGAYGSVEVLEGSCDRVVRAADVCYGCAGVFLVFGAGYVVFDLKGWEALFAGQG